MKGHLHIYCRYSLIFGVTVVTILFRADCYTQAVNVCCTLLIK